MGTEVRKWRCLKRERGLKENWTVLAYGNGHMGTEVRNRMRSTAFFSARAMHQARPLKDLCLVQSTSAWFGSCKSFKFGRQRKATSQQESCKWQLHIPLHWQAADTLEANAHERTNQDSRWKTPRPPRSNVVDVGSRETKCRKALIKGWELKRLWFRVLKSAKKD